MKQNYDLLQCYGNNHNNTSKRKLDDITRIFSKQITVLQKEGVLENAFILLR